MRWTEHDCNIIRLNYVRGEVSARQLRDRFFPDRTIAAVQSQLWKVFNSSDMVVGAPRKYDERTAALRSLFAIYKYSAKKRGYSWSLKYSEFEHVVLGQCHYCGDSLGNEHVQKGNRAKYTGIDRLDNSIGYTASNAVSCCWRCNQAKHAADYDEFLDHVKRIYEHMRLSER